MLKPVQASTYTFRNLIEGGFLYIDKTRYLYELVRPGTGIYFLSRPRRFGKSLMISTLEEIFYGNKELFKGLWIAGSDYDWQTYPVIRIDFSRHAVQSAVRLERVLDYVVEEIAQQQGVTLRGFDYQSRFDNLIQQLAREAKKVVILIDEYDKPLIDNLGNVAEAIVIRDLLKNFYSVIKALDQYIRFVFITGISKFSKVGVFSTLNNLTDLTMNPRFATALGITEEEMAEYLHDHIVELASKEETTPELLSAKIQYWYDGFCFVEKSATVYNPFSTLQLFYNQRFTNYWFESGTPTFLIKLIKERGYNIHELDDLEVSELEFSTFEIDNLAIVPLLFQTGYLTIKDYEETRRLYTLYYPNYEVENAFLIHLLRAFTPTSSELSEGYLWKMIDALIANDLKQFFAILSVLFANIPYGIHVKEEKYYQSLFVLLFKLIGLRIDAEVQTNEGRIDAVIELPKRLFLFEFKLDKSAQEALNQIRHNEYYQKYRSSTKLLTLIGVNFDSSTGKVSEWKSELDGNQDNPVL